MRKKVLVVEDNEDDRNAVLRVLDADHDVMLASTVREGLELAPIADVILLDMKLGPGTGDQFLKALRTWGFYTPVIVISGLYPRHIAEERLGQYKIVDFIGKPFEAKDLLGKVLKAEQLSGALESTCEAVDRFSAAADSLRMVAGKSITELGRKL